MVVSLVAPDRVGGHSPHATPGPLCSQGTALVPPEGLGRHASLGADDPGCKGGQRRGGSRRLGASCGILDGLMPTFFTRSDFSHTLYDRVRMLEAEQIDFAMDTKSLKGPKLSFTSTPFSKTLLVFYLAIAVGVITAALLVQT